MSVVILKGAVLVIFPEVDAIPLVSVELSPIPFHCERRASIPEATLLALAELNAVTVTPFCSTLFVVHEAILTEA